MTRSTDKLLGEIQAFLDRTALSPSAFGEQVMGDRHLVRRLRSGGSVTLDTADIIRAFIRSNRIKRRTRRRSPAPDGVAA